MYAFTSSLLNGMISRICITFITLVSYICIFNVYLLCSIHLAHLLSADAPLFLALCNCSHMHRVWERRTGRGWAKGKVVEEGGEEGVAHSCGRLIESQHFVWWSCSVWEWSEILVVTVFIQKHTEKALYRQSSCLETWRQITLCVFGGE